MKGIHQLTASTGKTGKNGHVVIQTGRINLVEKFIAVGLNRHRSNQNQMDVTMLAKQFRHGCQQGKLVFLRVDSPHVQDQLAMVRDTMFFTKDGKALYGTPWATLRSYVHAYITESVGSHFCVGLTSEDSKTLFNWTPVQTRVVILEEEPEEGLDE